MIQSPEKLSAYIDTIFAESKSKINSTDAPDNLEGVIEQRIELVSALFAIPQSHAHRVIYQFVHEYIASCPDLFCAFDNLGEITNIPSYTQPFLHKAYDFFFINHPAIDKMTGCHALLSKAYLFHRMLEELNDRVMVERQHPLAPVDISHTNLIAHTLIGDEDANLLDQTILIELELINVTLKNKVDNIFSNEEAKKQTAYLKKQGWSDVLNRWPILGKDLAQILDQ